MYDCPSWNVPATAVSKVNVIVTAISPPGDSPPGISYPGVMYALSWYSLYVAPPTVIENSVDSVSKLS